MPQAKMTLAEFKEAFNGCGESVMQIAFYAAERIMDDAQLVAAAKEALEAESKLSLALAERGIFA